jgi:hypothetical protein
LNLNYQVSRLIENTDLYNNSFEKHRVI